MKSVVLAVVAKGNEKSQTRFRGLPKHTCESSIEETRVSSSNIQSQYLNLLLD